jgi:hypothetical protein
VNFGKDYVYFGQKLVAKPTSYVPHEPHFLLFNIVSIIIFYIVPLVFLWSGFAIIRLVMVISVNVFIYRYR